MQQGNPYNYPQNPEPYGYSQPPPPPPQYNQNYQNAPNPQYQAPIQQDPMQYPGGVSNNLDAYDIEARQAPGFRPSPQLITTLKVIAAVCFILVAIILIWRFTK